MRVLLAGGTGLVGRHCLDLLLQDTRFTEIKALTRRPLYRENPRLRELIVNFDQLQNWESEFNVDILICCLGSTIKDAGSRAAFTKVDHDYPLELARLAHRQGVGHFIVVSAIGANKNSLFFYSRVKGLMEEALTEIPFNTITIFQPSFIEGERKEVRVMEELSLKISRPFSGLLKGRLEKFKPVPAVNIAKAICHVAKTSPQGINRYLTPTINDFANRYSV